MGSINCYVPNRSGDKIEIDMIMLCQKGIYVIENKNYSGWIFGDEKSKNWCEILKGKKYFFYNPIKQNKSHIKNLEKQLQVIINAMGRLGLKAEKSGRNDILIDGKKFSGNAFYEQEKHCYHHGTIMVDVNKEILSRYLTVSKDKLKSKGVDSVKSRVTNLVDYIPDLTLEALKKALREAFEEVYGLTSNECKMEDLDQKEIEMRTKHFSSWDWRFGRKIDFQYEISKRFSWGQMNIQFQVDKGKISDVNVYSDSLKPMTIEKLPKYLKGIRYHKKNICSELRLYWAEDKQEEEMIADIIEWIKEEEL